ncbi:MAG: DNA recombination protein RmuC [Candidatus Omnitrophica bacterium]|jgi:DNA recombination protein RmuC|nr:DNA recombination protein RmuC [Candidatus Omnitrophota bacterium]
MNIYIFLGVIIVLLIVIFIILLRMNKSTQDNLLHQKIDYIKDEFTKNILQSQSNSLQASKNLLGELSKLYEKIGNLDRDSSQILSLTKSFHDILKPTKARGVVGEIILDALIRDILPADVILTQHTFRNGKKVDFIIKLPQGLVPIDAKFSLDTFKSYIEAQEADREKLKKTFLDGVKKRIDETSTYIFTDEGTTDFCLMYVPSEAVYYSIVTETTMLDYAHAKRVFVVGPSTLYAYLKTIFIGLNALKIEKKAKEIYDILRRLDGDIKIILQDHAVLGTHLRNASLKYDDVKKKIESVSLKIDSMGKSDDDKS